MGKLKLESLEELLYHVIQEYQQVSTVASGGILRDPDRTDDNKPCLTLRPSLPFEPDCPKNFGEFFSEPGGQKLIL